ncbi:hypothetical protein [Alistipes putredinis]|uniref:hypothetical protein n=1 Tax=Alistipes putredinis TaxID=28117 RepID=UPI00399511FB
MRRLTLLPLLILPLLAAAQEERPAWSLPIEEVPVVTRRTMKEIGVQRTQLDSTVLHDNISLSMADVLTQNANLFIKSYGRATPRDGRIPRHVALAHAGDVERDADQLADARHGRLLDDPAFFIDAATLLHGASSIGVTGGALGGAVVRSAPARPRSGLADAIRAGRRVVLDLRPIPARELRRPAVERL